ncbi:MAG: enoyl-CoA hydratase/isomerase family protein [Alphaproteobacteria bacterium]|nr:enoyl-CoA hydratase/isomerase family protein [Alphaproteobacteria bacterium]MBU1512735.1 enoyl-CoA hydratase/isomerase family protein [Alphaproteobacteria bacterium]MBU2096114.1 enoyl-CoA hydratase/isomerase family protein [Alphaproteobacteria bacterium]MBU2152470.1 enoyl-CoA hydratase/isomerase family protein [Alphaproteobacteria bacterium]MBU2307996.1 enoyl-CoA hydratase/isomerase family protein [Alphaproteobacteria bacterium]
MTDHILSAQADGVLTLTFNRPEKKNAITGAMYQALGDAIDGANADAGVRCILVQANGDSFTAGNDLGEFAAVNAGDGAANEARGKGNPLLIALGRAKKPIVAAVHGRAVGVGVTMLLHCDLVYVAEDALLSTPFVNLALAPEAASSLLLPARIGHARAFSMFVLGETIDGRTAAAWGIANAAVPMAELRERALKAAQAVAARAAASVQGAKALMRDEPSIQEQMVRENAIFSAQLKSAEAKEAFAAFAEKRAPDFSKVA